MKILSPIVLFFVIFIIAGFSAAGDLIIISSNRDFNQLELKALHENIGLNGGEGIALALSGGGARGLAQIGVLEVLDENHIPIKFIAGTSMGAVIGGLYCAGYSPHELHQLALSIDWQDLFTSAPLRSAILVSAKGWPEKALLKFGIENWRPVLPKAITSAQKLSNLLTKLCYRAGVRASLNYDLLNPPFRATATDLATGKPEVISRGDLAEALRAAMAFPVGFTPVFSDGRLLVDGGLINPIPVDICLELSEHPVVAVNTTSPLLPVKDIVDAIDMANQSTTVMSLPRLTEAIQRADLNITPDIGFHKASDFSQIEYLIQRGRKAALDALPKIQEAINKQTVPNGDKTFFVIDATIEGLRSLPQSFFTSQLIMSGQTCQSEIKDRLDKIISDGYISKAIAEIRLEENLAHIIYRLIDYPRITKINISGISLLPPGSLFEVMESRVGQVANIRRLNQDLRRIERLYAAAGYSLVLAKIDNIDQLTGEVTIAIDEGRINEIRVDGNRRTRDWIILRDFHLRPGDFFTEKKAQRSLDDLYATGLFESVKLSAEPDSDGINLVIKVEEKSFDYIRAGLRYDGEYRTQGFADLVFANLRGTGNEINISNQLGEKKQAISVNVKADRIFKTYLTYRLTAYHNNFHRNIYNDHRRIGELKEISSGAELELGQQFPRLGKLSAVLSFSKHEFNQPLERRKTARIAAISFRSLVDTFDDVPFTNSGKYHYFDIEFAGDVLGGELVYTRIMTVLEAYYKLGKKLNFHPRIAFGVSNRQPPYFKYFDLGGYDTFYGLFDHEIMGEKLLNGNLELRRELLGGVYLAARYDLGNVWNNNDSIKFTSLRHGAGLALLFKTPIGPIGIAYGRADNGNDAFYFYAGHSY